MPRNSGTTQILKYDSAESKEIIDKILAYLLGRPLQGATQEQIAIMLGVSVQTANRYIQHLLTRLGKPEFRFSEVIHIAVKAQAQGRNSPAIYKHGYPIVTRFHGHRYTDLPPGFFGRGIERRKRKRMSNLIEGGTEVKAASQGRVIMTNWFSNVSFAPERQGAYLCRMNSALTSEACNAVEKTHKRWFDGERWSWPLQAEHEREDGFVKPHEQYFMDPDFTPAFDWRGFTEDQEPL